MGATGFCGRTNLPQAVSTLPTLFEHIAVLCRVIMPHISCLIKCFIGVELFALETHSVWMSAEVVQVPRRRFPRPLHPCYDSSSSSSPSFFHFVVEKALKSLNLFVLFFFISNFSMTQLFLS